LGFTEENFFTGLGFGSLGVNPGGWLGRWLLAKAGIYHLAAIGLTSISPACNTFEIIYFGRSPKTYTL